MWCTMGLALCCFVIVVRVIAVAAAVGADAKPSLLLLLLRPLARALKSPGGDLSDAVAMDRKGQRFK